MKKSVAFLLLPLLLFSACSQRMDSTPGPTAAVSRATAAAAAVLPTATAVPPTLTLAPTSTPTPAPQPTSIYPALSIAEELPALGPSGLADLHNVILFRSEGGVPFDFGYTSEADLGNVGALRRFCHNADGYGCLWGLSPDGQRAGLISPETFDFNLYLLPDGTAQFVENGFVVNVPSIQPVSLPDVCSQDPNSTPDQRCDQIQFSPDGRYLVFRYGQDMCGRSMQVLDRQTGKTILNLENGVHGYNFLPSGKLVVRQGHCEGSFVRFFDPVMRSTIPGGGTGAGVWNQARSILVVAEDSYMGNSSVLWGYNTQKNAVFHPEGKNGNRYDEHVLFMQDDRRFIYQHLALNGDGAAGTVINAPAQIVRYDPISDQRTVLASDPAYHYRFCQFDYQQPCLLLWYGDWVQIQRIPFTPFSPKGEWDVHSALPCLEEGQQCPTPPESLALNAVTGEIKPWDPAALPQLAYPTPTPTPGPNLLASPIYTDPEGRFSLHVGADGKSLWMLPKGGSAVRWVYEGEGFVYLP